jgi:hypothetical protein
MILSEIEISQITSIMNNYRSIHNDLNLYEKSLNILEMDREEKDLDLVHSLGTKIRESVSRLNKERENEKDFFNLLSTKYGPGELDTNTLEYKTKEAIKN